MTHTRRSIIITALISASMLYGCGVEKQSNQATDPDPANNDKNAFFKALDANDIEKVRKLLKAGEDPNRKFNVHPTSEKKYPIFIAIGNKNLAILKVLTSYSANTNQSMHVEEWHSFTDGIRVKPLCFAITQRDQQIVKHLIEKNAAIQCGEGRSVLTHVIRTFPKDLAFLNYLLDQLTPSEIAESYIKLHSKYYNMGDELAELAIQLISRGADPNHLTTPCTDFPILHKVGLKYNFVKRLVELGARPNIGNYFSKRFISNYNYKNPEHIKILDLYLSLGLKFHARTIQSLVRRALSALRDNNHDAKALHLKLMKRLLPHIKDLNVVFRSPCSSSLVNRTIVPNLILGIRSRSSLYKLEQRSEEETRMRLELADEIMAHGGDPTPVLRWLLNPEFYEYDSSGLFTNYSKRLFRFLEGHVVNPRGNATDVHSTPLLHVAIRENVEWTEFLLRHGAKPDTLYRCTTPLLMLCYGRGKLSVADRTRSVKALVKAGAATFWDQKDPSCVRQKTNIAKACRDKGFKEAAEVIDSENRKEKL